MAAFIDKGIPVILGEYGCLLMNRNPASRINYFRSIVKHSTDLGICRFSGTTARS